MNKHRARTRATDRPATVRNHHTRPPVLAVGPITKSQNDAALNFLRSTILARENLCENDLLPIRMLFYVPKRV